MIALVAILSLQQAISAYEAGRLGEAQAALAGRVLADPLDAESATWLGAALIENPGDAGGAQEVLEGALRADPGSWRAHMLLGVALAMRIESASIFGKISLAGRMKSELELAVALSPRSPEPRMALIQYLLHAPRIAGGGVDKARAQAREIAALHPFEGLIAEGLIAAREGEEAEPIFRRAAAAARSEKERARALDALAQLLLAKQRPAEAIAEARAAALARPQDPLLRVQAGKAELAAGDAESAFASFGAAADLDAALCPAWLGLGRALEKLGRGTMARAAYARYLELAPRGAAASEAQEKLDALR